VIEILFRYAKINDLLQILVGRSDPDQMKEPDPAKFRSKVAGFGA